MSYRPIFCTQPEAEPGYRFDFARRRPPTRRAAYPGLLAALLVLMVQLAAGAYVPRGGMGTEVLGTICHARDDAPGAPPPHRTDCLVCPLCAFTHAPPVTLPPLAAALPLPLRYEQIGVRPEVQVVEQRAEPRPPNQPRAPPAFA